MVQELKLFSTEAEAEEHARLMNMMNSTEHYTVGMTLDLDSYIIMVYDANGKFVDYWREE